MLPLLAPDSPPRCITPSPPRLFLPSPLVGEGPGERGTNGHEAAGHAPDHERHSRDFHANGTPDAISIALLDSVRHHLEADVPVGAFLSAGVDSGALVGLMRDAGQQDITTVTLAFSESRLQAKASAASASPLHRNHCLLATDAYGSLTLPPVPGTSSPGLRACRADRPRGHRKKQGKMSELVGTRRNSCLFIVERISNNTDPLAPNPGLTLAGGPARIDASNDTAGR